jgi:hypothetical protein
MPQAVSSFSQERIGWWWCTGLRGDACDAVQHGNHEVRKLSLQLLPCLPGMISMNRSTAQAIAVAAWAAAAVEEGLMIFWLLGCSSCSRSSSSRTARFFSTVTIQQNITNTYPLPFVFPNIRLVNGFVENPYKKTGLSISELADAVGIPRVLVDIRHG